MMSKRYWDVTLPLFHGLTTYPNIPPFEMERYRSLDKGDKSNSTQFRMSAHHGTHVDAPFHFVAGGEGIDQFAPEKLCGECVVLQIDDPSQIKKEALLRKDLFSTDTRFLFKTINSQWWSDLTHEFRSDFVSLGPDAAEFLVSRGAQLVGIDYLSIQRFKAYEERTHQILLDAKVAIIEGLDLSRVPEGRYELFCLPLKLVGADAAPARVVLREP